MASDSPEILSHIPNSGIVHMPGRKFPGVVIQGDTLFNLLNEIRFLLGEFKRLGDEDRYYEILEITMGLQAQLEHYEKTLEERNIELPYFGSVHTHPIMDDFAFPDPNGIKDISPGS